MVKSKRVFALMLIFIFVLSITMAGCTSKDKKVEETKGTAQPAASAAVQPTASTKAALPPVELTFYTFVEKKQQDEVMVLTEVNKYLKEKINATLKGEFLTGEDFQAKIPIFIASGQPMDIVLTTSWGSVQLYPNIAKGAFLPLNELIDKYAPETKKSIPQLLWDVNTVAGKTYAVPFYKEVGHQFGFMINKTMADKNGIDLSKIKKFADIEPILQVIKDKEPGVIPFAGASSYDSAFPVEHITGDWGLPGVLNVKGNEAVARNDDKIYNQYETPEFKAFTEMMYKWSKAGYIPKDADKYGERKDNDYKAGKVFSWALWTAPNYEKSYTKTSGIDSVFVKAYDPIAETGDIAGGFAISKNSENPERAMMFLNLLNTDKKLGTLLRHGIEGKHYVKVDDNTLDVNAPGVDAKNHPYNLGLGWTFGSIFNSMLDVSYPKDTFDAYLKYNAGAKGTPGLGFVFDPKPVQPDIAAVQNVLKQYLGPLTLGMVDPAVYLPKFVSALKANHADRIIEEAQKQFDAWKVANGK